MSILYSHLRSDRPDIHKRLPEKICKAIIGGDSSTLVCSDNPIDGGSSTSLFSVNPKANEIAAKFWVDLCQKSTATTVDHYLTFKNIVSLESSES